MKKLPNILLLLIFFNINFLESARKATVPTTPITQVQPVTPTITPQIIVPQPSPQPMQTPIKTQPQKRRRRQTQASVQQQKGQKKRATPVPATPIPQIIQPIKPLPQIPSKALPQTSLKPIQQTPTGPTLTGGNFPTNSAIIILDPKKEETLDRRVGAMVEVALRALYEQTAPIIMTSNILEIITTIIQRIGTNNLQQLKNAPYNQINNYAIQLQESGNLATVSPLFLIVLSVIEFNKNNFNCYLHKNSNLVLLIPKQYINSNLAKAASMNEHDQAQACGFNPKVLTTVHDLTPNNLLPQLQLQQSKPFNEQTFIAQLTSLFIPQKINGQLISPEQNSKWIMYIVGHGHPAHQTIGTVREQLNVHKKNHAMLQSGRVKQDQNYFIIKAQAEEYIPKYEKILEGKSNWPDTQLIPETGGIAGITADAFSQLITFFNNSLNMGYLHYMSCFAGGYNQSFVNETLSSLNTNFIVSSEGVHESSVSTSGIGAQFSSRPPHIQIKKSFTSFFTLLRLFIAQPEEFVKNKEKGKDPVAQILRTIVPNMQEGNQPFVRFPGAGVFGALSLGKSTKKLTKTIVKAHEIENKSIDVSNTDINMVVIDAPRINVPLIFKKNSNCAIVSPTPTTLTTTQEIIHVFKEINFEGTLKSLLYNIIHLNARINPQTFVVNTVTGLLKQPGPNIRNLIIHLKGFAGEAPEMVSPTAIQANFLSPENIQYSRIGVNVQVIFELNNIMYQCTMGIKDFDNSTILQNYFQQIAFQPIKATNMNAIAGLFLTPKEIIKLAQPITLNSITEFIDDKIDTQQSLPESSPEAYEALRDFTTRTPQEAAKIQQSLTR